MSSVSGSDRNRANETIQRIRQDYKQQQAKQEERHAEKVSSLTEQYNESLESLQDKQNRRLGEMREKLTEEISERDRAHQREIQQLRDIHKERLSSKLAEADKRTNYVKQDMAEQLNREQRASGDKFDRMQTTLSKEISQRETAFAERGRDMREKVIQSRESLQKQMQARHEQEQQLLRDQQKDKLSSLQGDVTRARRFGEERYEDLSQKKEGQEKRLQSNFEIQIQAERNKLAQAFDEVTAASKESRAQTQEKYQQALDAKAEQHRAAFKDLREKVDSRVNNKLTALESELQGVKESKVVDQSRQKAEFDREKRNIAKAFTAQLENLDEQRQAAVEQANLGQQGKINEVITKKDRHLRQALQAKSEDMSLAHLRSKEARGQMEITHKNMVDHIQSQADQRIESITENSHKTEEKLAKFFEENLELKAKTYEQSLEDLRRDSQQKTMDLRSNFVNRMRKIEEQAEKKLTGTKREYENQIANLKENHKTELERHRERFESLSKQREQSHQYEAKTQELRFKTQMEKVRDNHDKEIANLEQRHRNEMESFIKQQKFASRKITS